MVFIQEENKVTITQHVRNIELSAQNKSVIFNEHSIKNTRRLQQTSGPAVTAPSAVPMKNVASTNEAPARKI